MSASPAGPFVQSAVKRFLNTRASEKLRMYNHEDYDDCEGRCRCSLFCKSCMKDFFSLFLSLFLMLLLFVAFALMKLWSSLDHNVRKTLITLPERMCPILCFILKRVFKINLYSDKTRSAARNTATVEPDQADSDTNSPERPMDPVLEVQVEVHEDSDTGTPEKLEKPILEINQQPILQVEEAEAHVGSDTDAPERLTNPVLQIYQQPKLQAKDSEARIDSETGASPGPSQPLVVRLEYETRQQLERMKEIFEIYQEMELKVEEPAEESEVPLPSDFDNISLPNGSSDNESQNSRGSVVKLQEIESANTSSDSMFNESGVSELMTQTSTLSDQESVHEGDSPERIHFQSLSGEDSELETESSEIVAEES